MSWYNQGMQSVWTIVHGGEGWKVVDVTGKPELVAADGPALTTGPHMHGALVAAVEYARTQNRRITSVVRLDGECVLVVD